jgi:hypothetical protein
VEGVVGQDGDNIVDVNIVTWVTTSFNHKASAENMPVLNSEMLSITLEPDNFFVQNPAMDVATHTVVDPTKIVIASVPQGSYRHNKHREMIGK